MEKFLVAAGAILGIALVIVLARLFAVLSIRMETILVMVILCDVMGIIIILISGFPSHSK